MMETTFWLTGNLPGSVVSAISPTHSIPRIRGNFTVSDSPLRVKISEWLIPNPLTLTRLQPGFNCGRGTSWYISFSGPPDSLIHDIHLIIYLQLLASGEPATIQLALGSRRMPKSVQPLRWFPRGLAPPVVIEGLRTIIVLTRQR